MYIINILILAVVFIIAIGFHEYAHAYVSNILGDPTPKLQDKLTPNPIKHLSLIGFLMIFLIHFGRGKPVQTDPSYYKSPLKDELLVALAGPFMNILMAFCGSLIIVFLTKIGQTNYLIGLFFQTFIQINIFLAIFNMLPIYPLDGYRVVKFLKPDRAIFMEQNALTFTIIFLFIVFTFREQLLQLMYEIASPIYSLFMGIANFIF